VIACSRPECQTSAGCKCSGSFFLPLRAVTEATYSRPTSLLRWLNGRLQQQFEIGRGITDKGHMIPDRLEWRDVPSVISPEVP
jgi:hypothetical protein